MVHQYLIANLGFLFNSDATRGGKSRTAINYIVFSKIPTWNVNWLTCDLSPKFDISSRGEIPKYPVVQLVSTTRGINTICEVIGSIYRGNTLGKQRCAIETL